MTIDQSENACSSCAWDSVGMNKAIRARMTPIACFGQKSIKGGVGHPASIASLTFCCLFRVRVRQLLDGVPHRGP